MSRIPRILPPDITGQLGSAARWSILLRVSNAALSLMASVLLARLLGPDGYGIYAVALAVVMLLALPTQAGLPTLLVREVARYDRKQDWSAIRGLLRRSNQIVGWLTLLLGGCAVGLVLLFGHRPESEFVPTFLWALPLLPLIALGNLRGAALRGLRRVIQGQLPEFLLRPGLFVLLLLVFLGNAARGPEPSPELAMALYAASALVAFCIGLWLLRRALPGEAHAARPTYHTMEWIRSLLPLTLLAGLEMINNQMDVVLLGLLTTARDVGIYRVAYQMSIPVVFTLTAVNLVAGPHFARAYAEGNLERLQRLATWSARVALGVALPGALALVFFGGPLLGAIFGPEFAEGRIALALLVVGQLASVAAGSVGTILNMTGHERDTMFGVGIAAVTNLVLNLILIPVLGIAGAAIATTTSLVVWNTLLLVRVRRRLGVSSAAWERSGTR